MKRSSRLANLLWLAVVAVPLIATMSARAERAPVLSQIEVPHNYYYREMYLPQLTSGPGSLAWSPDGETLVYSMQGSLWRQEVDSGVATQLTAGPGYDYQPDWSPDGSRIVFTRYHDDAVELQLLDVATGEALALTDEGAVNVEPRWSPDGARIAFVSTRDNGRFQVYVGDVVEDTLAASPLFEERLSEVSRYYYSPWDHQLSPSWSPDGDSIVYVANPEIPYGSGAIWRRTLEGDTEPVLVRMEETSWQARPDWSPDGNRVAYASYVGRQWHQLWVTSVRGNAEPFPLTYGDFDISSPRWSPDGRRIAFIANEAGNTEIRVQELVGGRTLRLAIEERRYLQPMATIRIETLDQAGTAVAARLAVVGAGGRSYAPDTALMHADDSFDRSIAEFETSYFHSDGEAIVTVPAGNTWVTAWRGPEYEIKRVAVDARPDTDHVLTMSPASLDLPQSWSDWRDADVHVHMNYGGTYRNTPAGMLAQARAEDLDVVFNLIVNKEQRIPDIAYFSAEPDAASDESVLLMHAQEYHTSFWGHLGLIGLGSHLLLPDYSAYPETAAASLFPDNATIAELAREQGALVGYVHPFDPPRPDPQADASLTNALPVDAALGLVDYYEVVGFANAHVSAEVWYGLLNCGLRVAAAGGTDAMANYASLRGPVGTNRTYVRTGALAADPAARQQQWLDALRAQRSLATNGPLLSLDVAGREPGEELRTDSSDGTLRVSGFMRSAVPVDHLELVYNGRVVRAIELEAPRTSADFELELAADESGWLLLRAWNDGSHPLIFDLFPYATTSPVYLTVDGAAPRSTEDADYFMAWIGRIREAVGAHEDFNDAAEKASILARLSQAERRFEACREQAGTR